MKDCMSCDFSDEDYGCVCPHSDKWYACPIESKKPENIKALKEYAEWEGRRMTEQEKFSDTAMNIAAGYLMNGCEGCPFYGIEEYEIRQICDSKPINCVWWWMNRYFKQVEREEAEEDEV